MLKYLYPVRPVCPYCKHQGKFNAYMSEKLETGELFIVRCDSKEGGCDKDYAIKAELELTLTSYQITKAVI